MKLFIPYRTKVAHLFFCISIFFNVPVQFFHQHVNAYSAIDGETKSVKEQLKSVCAICSFEYQVQNNDAVFIPFIVYVLYGSAIEIGSVGTIDADITGLNNKSPPIL